MSHIGWSGPKIIDYYSRATKLKALAVRQLSLTVSDNETEIILKHFGDFSNFKNPIVE